MARFKHVERVDEIAKLKCENQECSSCQFRDHYSTCIERYTNNLIYDTAYQDAAREIFEEIGKLIIYRMIADTPLIDDRLITDVAQLKKKYTESEE